MSALDPQRKRPRASSKTVRDTNDTALTGDRFRAWSLVGVAFRVLVLFEVRTGDHCIPCNEHVLFPSPLEYERHAAADAFCKKSGQRLQHLMPARDRYTDFSSAT
jgi:hypothetical protein